MRNSKGQFIKGINNNGELSPAWRGGVSKQKDYSYVRARRERMAAIEILGGKCCKCDFSDVRALQIDHINGNGKVDRKTVKGRYHVAVLESVLKNENKYQLLCANCNWIKKFENNEIRTKSVNI